MVAMTAGLGWELAGGRLTSDFFGVIFGTIFASAASGALNQWYERREDALMRRTLGRPLPSGRIKAWKALLFGLALAVLGPVLVAMNGGTLAGLLTLATIVIYVGIYTPLKKVTPQTTWIGAVAGAMPPLIGWAAATGTLGPKAWALFGIQFLWQIPHFLALFWIHREDFARAGFRMMPVVYPDGNTTAIQIALHSFTLLPATLLPVVLGMAGTPYAVGALVVGVVFLGLGLRASWTMAHADARRLFLASLAHLPLIFAMLYFGGV